MHRTLIAAAALAATGLAQAQTYPPPQNVVSLTASATVEVTKDVLGIAFGATREGSDANTVQGQLKQAIDAALAEAKKVARPGQIEVHTGNFSLYPRYSNKGGITGWQGSAELVVEGKDITGIAQLAGKLPSVQIQRVNFSLSREAREKVESDITAQAIASFRQKAEAVSRLFGFGGYSVREVAVTTSEPGGTPVPMFRTRTAAAPMADEALPVEAGKASVTATVSGSVTMSPGPAK